MTAVERLAEIEARAADATDGPWRGRNADYLAAARSDVSWLVEQVRIRDAAIEALLALCDGGDLIAKAAWKDEARIPTSVLRALLAAVPDVTS